MARNSIIAVIATFCLSAALFLIIQTGSVGSPCELLLDYKHNSARGDPTINVDLTNWSDSPQYELTYLGRINVSSWTYGFQGVWNYSGSYSRMSIMVEPSDMAPGTYDFTLRLRELQWGISDVHTMSSETPNFAFTVHRDSRGWGYTLPEPLFVETKAPYFTLWFSGNATESNVWMTIDVWAYLRGD